MAKSINVSGRMSVGRFEEEFEKTFGVRCNVKLSKWRNADNKATLASIRPKDFDAPKKVNLPIVGNMTVRTLKARFEANFGVMIELYVGRKIAPDNVTIGAIREGRVNISKDKKTDMVEEKVELSNTSENSNESVSLSEEQIKEFEEKIESAEDHWDYISAAKEIGYEGDKKWAREVFKKAESLLENSADFSSMAESVSYADYLGDKEYATELYKKAEELAEEFYEVNNLADSVADEDYLGDKKYARELYKKAELTFANERMDFKNLADSIADESHLGDKEYARELYKKAESLCEDSSDFQDLASSVAQEEFLNDKNYASELLKHAEQLAEKPWDFRHLANGYLYCLNDKEKAREIFKKCEKSIDDYEYGQLPEYWNESKYQQIVYLANVAMEEYYFDEDYHVFDKEYAIELYKKAEFYVSKYNIDSEELVNSLANFDEKWSKNVKKGKYGTQGTLDEPNDTKSEGFSETTLVKIEIHDEEQNRAYNVVDVVFNKSIDTTNFNADSYNSLITDDDFLKKAKESIEAADGWKYGYYIDGEEISLKDVIDYVSYGDSILIRLISVGEKELPFLSVDNFSDDGKEEFLKGTLYESKLDDDDFEDNYNECIGSDNLLAFDYVINYEG